jgi:hypothetical protein
MNCKTFKRNLPDFIVGEIYDFSLLSSMEEHMKQCVECKLEYDRKLAAERELLEEINNTDIEFNSKRTAVMYTLDKGYYGNSLLDRLTFNMRSFKMRYVSAAAAVFIMVFVLSGMLGAVGSSLSDIYRNIRDGRDAPGIPKYVYEIRIQNFIGEAVIRNEILVREFITELEKVGSASSETDYTFTNTAAVKAGEGTVQYYDISSNSMPVVRSEDGSLISISQSVFSKLEEEMRFYGNSLLETEQIRIAAEKGSAPVLRFHMVKELNAFKVMGTPIDELILEEEPILTDKDIVSFNWTDSTLRFNKGDIWERLWPIVKTDGGPFVIVVGDRRVLQGTFWTGLSSTYPPSTPLIMVDYGEEVEIINYGDFASRSYRGEIADAFRRVGKLTHSAVERIEIYENMYNEKSGEYYPVSERKVLELKESATIGHIMNTMAVMKPSLKIIDFVRGPNHRIDIHYSNGRKRSFALRVGEYSSLIGTDSDDSAYEISGEDSKMMWDLLNRKLEK